MPRGPWESRGFLGASLGVLGSLSARATRGQGLSVCLLTCVSISKEERTTAWLVSIRLSEFRHGRERETQTMGSGLHTCQNSTGTIITDGLFPRGMRHAGTAPRVVCYAKQAYRQMRNLFTSPPTNIRQIILTMRNIVGLGLRKSTATTHLAPRPKKPEFSVSPRENALPHVMIHETKIKGGLKGVRDRW